MDIIKFHVAQQRFRACHLEPSRAILFCRHLDIWLQQLNENNADLISNNNIYRDMY